MDPLSALGLAGNIVTFIEFSSNLISGAYEIYRSADGVTSEVADATVIIRDLQVVTQRLNSPPGPQSDDDKALASLVKGCKRVSDNLLKELKPLQANPHSKSDSFRASWQAMRKRGKLESMAKTVDRYRQQILDRVTIMMWYVADSIDNISQLLTT